MTFKSLSLAIMTAFTVAVAVPAGASAQTVLITNSDIAHFRAALKLTTSQARMWPAVAAALRAYSRDQKSIDQLLPAVAPFYRTLNEGQQQVAKTLVRQVGLGAYAMLM